jgi:hypothetical protein
VFAGGDVVLKIGESESLSPLVFTVFDDGDREAGDMRGSHESGNGGFDLGALLGSEFRILSEATRRSRGTQGNHKREMNPEGIAQTQTSRVFLRRLDRKPLVRFFPQSLQWILHAE